MSAVAARISVFGEELVKLPAFVRRDFLVAWSYRMSFVTDAVNLVGQALLFYFVGLMVDPSALPRYGGSEVTYLEFAVVGIALGVFMHFALSRVATAVRGEQLMGTLESVLMTPTSPSTIQLGSVAFDLVYIPVRTAIFFAVLAATFGLNLDPGGLLPAAALLVAFIPFVWGLGIASAAAILTFRRGSGIVGFGAMGLALVSGLYFPVDLLPGWIVSAVEWNPIAVAIDGMRSALLGGAGWGELGPDILVLAPMSLGGLALGLVAFRLALRRERGTGTLGVY